MYVGPGGSTAFGKRWKWPGAPKAPSAPSTTTPSQTAPAGAVSSPGVTVTPGSPGTPTPPVPPFMTGPDIINYGDAFKGKGDQIAQADKDFGDVKAWAQTAIYNIGQNYLHGTDNTQNDAAARGIFQSSIKDGALADLAATKATLSSDVNTRLNNAEVFHDAAVKRINDWFDNFQEGMNAIKVGNAAAAGADAPPYVAGTETQPGAAATGVTGGTFGTLGWFTNPANGQRYQIIKSGGTTYHVYADGRRVRVA